jgi:hypothetical protein
VGPGASCVDDGDCEASFCDANTCTALLPGDAACVRDAQCASARCGENGACAGFEPRCVAEGP